MRLNGNVGHTSGTVAVLAESHERQMSLSAIGRRGALQKFGVCKLFRTYRVEHHRVFPRVGFDWISLGPMLPIHYVSGWVR